MTGDQSRTLSVGDRVCWHNDKNDQGTITETNWAGLTIKWDNRSEQAILHNDMTLAGVFKTMRKKSKLDIQCDEIGWPLNTTRGHYVGSGKWSFDEIVNCGPEEFVAAQLAAAGFRCCWCEGGSLNLLMKAAALDVLVRRNSFGDREDAIRRFLEAQFTLLIDHRLELVSCIRSIPDDQLHANILEICSDAFIRSYYPRVSNAFVTALAHAVGQHHLAEVATLCITKPYEYEAGQPIEPLAH